MNKEKTGFSAKSMSSAHVFLLACAALVVWSFVNKGGNTHIGLTSIRDLALIAIPVLLFFPQMNNHRQIVGGLAVAVGAISVIAGLMSAVSIAARAGIYEDMWLLKLLMAVIRNVPYLAALAAGLRILLDKKNMSDGLFKLLCALAFICAVVAFLMAGTIGIPYLESALLALILLGFIPLYSSEFKGSKVEYGYSDIIKGIVISAIVVMLAYGLGQIDFAHFSEGGGGGGGNSRTCKICGRTFTDSANTNSIARTGMCQNCYNNYKWAEAATGRDTAWHVCDGEDGCEGLILTFHSEEETQLEELLCRVHTAERNNAA